MIEVDVQAWTSTATVLTALLAAFGLLSRRIDRVEGRLDARIDKAEAGLGARIEHMEARVDRLAVHIDEGFGRVETRLTTLEQRSYDLGTRLRAAPGPAD